MTEIPGGVYMLTACQLRASRAMMRLSVEELAKATNLSEKTIRRIEQQYGTPNVTADVFHKLHKFFAEQGFTYAPEIGDERGPGVFWGRYPGRPVRNPVPNG